MTLRVHLQIVGALLLTLGIAHSFFSRYSMVVVQRKVARQFNRPADSLEILRRYV